MYFSLQQSLGLFKVPVTQTAETSFQLTSREAHNRPFLLGEVFGKSQS